MSDAVKPALHGRDHCPGGVDPIPCFGYPYIFRKHENGQTIEAGSVEYIGWDDDDFDEGAGFFSTDDNFTCNIIGPGVFDFLCGVYWDDSFNSTTMLQLACDAFGWFPTTYGKGRLFTSGGSELDSSGAMFIHFQARVASGTSATGVIIGHENASDQDISGAFLRIARIGSWGGDADADFAFV